MKDYAITYNNTEKITVRHITPEHARDRLRNVIPGVEVINSTTPVKSNEKR